MPKDIQIAWDEQLLEGDFLYSEGDLSGDPGLETAIIVSIFSDRRADDEDELPDLQNDDRRGWWGDLTLKETNTGPDKIGSRLWLLERAKTTPETVTLAKFYIEEALQWLIDDGVAIKVEVEVERQGTVGSDVLAFNVKIHKTDGDVEAFNFSDQWISQFS
jgi:phage gp46-like protein